MRVLRKVGIFLLFRATQGHRAGNRPAVARVSNHIGNQSKREEGHHEEANFVCRHLHSIFSLDAAQLLASLITGLNRNKARESRC